MKDKYTATWVSHSSISDFLKCPRSYYLKNIYKDKKTKNKMQIASPALSLGQAVHEVVESLSKIETDKRFNTPLIDRFEDAWRKVSGKRGGFLSSELEFEYKERGIRMLERVRRNPGPLKNLAVKIDMDLPHFWISEDENIILCGKIDWLEYDRDRNSVNIIDFKTSKDGQEDGESLQLPIYHLLAKNTQKYNVHGACYWYLEQEDEPQSKELPDYDDAFTRVLSLARKVKLARQLESFNCPRGEEGCRDCRLYERILKGEGELVYSDMGRDVYIIQNGEESREGTIL